MTQRPPLLPEQETHDIQPRRRGTIYTLALLLILLALSLATSVGVILYRPDLAGLAPNLDMTALSMQLDRTRAALAVTADTVERTAQANLAAQRDNESTREAFQEQQAEFEEAATQAALDQLATETAVAVLNARRATQAALEFEETQAAFDQQATRVELEYQGTRAALSRDATAVALGFATDPPDMEEIPPMPPTPARQPLLTDGFADGVIGGLWRSSAAADWGLDPDGVLVARRSGAWLLTELDLLADYALEVELLPVTGEDSAADYLILLNADGEPITPDRLALRLSYDGARLTAVGLFRLTTGGMSPLQAVQVDIPADTLSIRVGLGEEQVSVTVTGRLVLDARLETAPPPGSVGLQVPAGTRIRQVIISI
jgi:hypothetical protein